MMFVPCSTRDECTSIMDMLHNNNKLGNVPQASLVLSNVGSGVTLCNVKQSNVWDLTNQGVHDSSNNKVNWTINVTKSEDPSVPAELKVNGVITITNSGEGPADVGNIVVNLQKKTPAGQYQTFTSDIADVTNGDLFFADSTCSGQKIAYVAQKVGSNSSIVAYLENEFSGPLTFWNEDGNSIFSIVGGWTIAGGETKRLLFQAVFYIESLNLPDVKVETYVTFGNAGARGGSGATANGIKYKGDCVAYNNVRSVPVRFFLPIPPVELCNQSVSLSSVESDVTVNSGSFSGFISDIPSEGEVLSGSAVRHVTVTPDPAVSVDNRTFINCAHLTNPDEIVSVTVVTDPLLGTTKSFSFLCCRGVDLDACAPVVLPGQTECGCDNDGFTTYTQGGWGSVPRGNNPGAFLADNFDRVYPGGSVRIGRSAPGLHYAEWTSALAVQNFLPAGGPRAVLVSNLVNPTSTSAGVLAGQVLALTLNVDFSETGVTMLGLTRTLSSTKITTTSVSSVLGATLGELAVLFNGMTVGQVLSLCNDAISGMPLPAGISLSDLNEVATALNEAFDNGNAGPFSQYVCAEGSVPCVV